MKLCSVHDALKMLSKIEEKCNIQSNLYICYAFLLGHVQVQFKYEAVLHTQVCTIMHFLEKFTDLTIFFMSLLSSFNLLHFSSQPYAIHNNLIITAFYIDWPPPPPPPHATTTIIIILWETLHIVCTINMCIWSYIMCLIYFSQKKIIPSDAFAFKIIMLMI